MIDNAIYLKGQTIVLYETIESGRDRANRPIYEESAIAIDNVIIGSPTQQEIIDTLNLTGRKAVYVLGIPKGDNHDWTDKKVKFWGRTFKTIGAPIEGMEEFIPMEWHKQVRCEAYNE